MGPPIFWTDPTLPLVADASVVINLTATGHASSIVSALPNRLIVVEVVPAELETGRRRGRKDAERFNQLVTAGQIDIVQLDEAASLYFEQLVIGPASATLDDGEAATIAYAVEHSGAALIDERKANRICADRFPGLVVGCTVDILFHPEVERLLGADTVSVAVFNALYEGRMRVFQHHLEQVVGLIGRKRAALCQSLPRSVRQSLPDTNLEKRIQ